MTRRACCFEASALVEDELSMWPHVADWVKHNIFGGAEGAPGGVVGVHGSRVVELVEEPHVVNVLQIGGGGCRLRVGTDPTKVGGAPVPLVKVGGD